MHGISLLGFSRSLRVAVFMFVAVAFAATGLGAEPTKPDMSVATASTSTYEVLVIVSPRKPGTLYGMNVGEPMFLVTTRGAYAIPPAQRKALADKQMGEIVVCPPRLYASWPRVADVYGSDTAKQLTAFNTPDQLHEVLYKPDSGVLTEHGRDYIGTCVTGQIAAESCGLPDVAQIKMPAVAMTKLPRD